MKHKFFATGLIFIVCIVVFLVVSSQPVSINTRFNGVIFSGDKEVENDVKISFEGNLHDALFTKEKFTGYVTIHSKTLPEQYDAVTLEFKKNNKATSRLVSEGKEIGTLTVYIANKKFEKISLELSDHYSENRNKLYLAAPATSIEQAKELLS